MIKPSVDVRHQYSRWMYVLMWLLLLGLLSWLFHDWLAQQYHPNRQLKTVTTVTQKQVMIQRNRQWHYVVQGAINGHEVIFLLDTGATHVAIPNAMAKDLGLRLGRAHRVNTANGTAISYDTMLDSISVGDIELSNVPAALAPGYQSKAILLGMSFLKHIEFAQRGDTLTLRQ